MKHFIIAACLLLTMSATTALAKVPAEFKRVHAFIAEYSTKSAADRYTDLVVSSSRRHGLPALLTASLIVQESTFRPRAYNGGCYGLMQVAGFWFKRGNPYDPATNVNKGCEILAANKKRFGTWERALTAYNFGGGATVSRGLYTSKYAREILSRLR